MSDFELILVVDELSDDTIDEIYDRHDALVAGHDGTTLLTVTAPGANALAAAKKVIIDLEKIDGVVVSRCYEDFVSRKDIAERCDISPQAVGQWARNERHKTKPFPEPYNLVCGGIWLWGDVNDWLRRTGQEHDDMLYPCRDDYMEINRWIRDYRIENSVAVAADVVYGGYKTRRHIDTNIDSRTLGHVEASDVQETFDVVLLRHGDSH